MREKITERLDYFWDHDVRGPDFLWAAIGPGLEAYSAYDAVVRASGDVFTVAEFIKAVRQVTTEYALGKVMHGSVEGVDEWTRYALMHAQNFKNDPAPVGECILLAGAYGLDLNALSSPKGILRRGKTKAEAAEEEADSDDESAADSEGQPKGSGTTLRLTRFDDRKQPDLGEPRPDGGLPMIDQIHRLCREYDSGDLARYRDYRDRFALQENDLFWRVVQALEQLVPDASREKSVLQSILTQRNNVGPRTPTAVTGRLEF